MAIPFATELKNLPVRLPVASRRRAKGVQRRFLTILESHLVIRL
jgi:hypothetical protein